MVPGDSPLPGWSECRSSARPGSCLHSLPSTLAGQPNRNCGIPLEIDANALAPSDQTYSTRGSLMPTRSCLDPPCLGMCGQPHLLRQTTLLDWFKRVVCASDPLVCAFVQTRKIHLNLLRSRPPETWRSEAQTTLLNQFKRVGCPKIPLGCPFSSATRPQILVNSRVSQDWFLGKIPPRPCWLPREHGGWRLGWRLVLQPLPRNHR